MIELLTSPVLVGITGVLIGYFFKRIVLVGLSALVAVAMLWATVTLVSMSDHSLADLVLWGIIAQGVIFMGSMWVTYFVKRLGGVTASIKSLEDATVDREKKAD